MAVNGSWTNLDTLLEGYPGGVKRAIVILAGVDLGLRPGHLGPKFAQPQLRFVPEKEFPKA